MDLPKKRAGRKPAGDRALTPSEKQKAYRARVRAAKEASANQGAPVLIELVGLETPLISAEKAHSELQVACDESARLQAKLLASPSTPKILAEYQSQQRLVELAQSSFSHHAGRLLDELRAAINKATKQKANTGDKSGDKRLKNEKAPLVE